MRRRGARSSRWPGGPERSSSWPRKHGATVHVVAADLGSVAGAQGLVQEVEARGLDVDILVNNAGFGGAGVFHEQELSRNLGMVDLNIKALMVLTHDFAGKVAERGRGRILNVGSTAGMVPGPGQATYHATKSFVNAFSFALAEELRDRGVTVTVLAPGPVRTEFLEVADLSDAKGVQRAADPAAVARVGYRAMEKGRLLAIDDPALRVLLEWLLPFMPRRLVLRLARQFAEPA